MKKLLIIILCSNFSMAFSADTARLTILFPFNKYELTNQAKQDIDNFFARVDTNIYFIQYCSINGYTDQVGGDDYNLKLSTNRAQATYYYLQNYKEYIGYTSKVLGLGKANLLTTEIDESKKYINRRVEMVFIAQKRIFKAQDVAVYKDEEQVEINNIGYKKTQKIEAILSDTTAAYVGKKIILPYILFIGGTHDFLTYSYPYLDELYLALKNNPKIFVEIQGHICCSSGEEDGIDNTTGLYNLSEARAFAVYRFLVEKGIDKNRLMHKGYGHKFPYTQERNEEERQRNRRVEIKILKR